MLIYKFLQVFPFDENHVVVFESFPECGANDEIVVALTPGRAIVGMVDGNGLQLGVVVSEVDNYLRDAWLQLFDCIPVELIPLLGRQVGPGHDQGAGDDLSAIQRNRGTRCGFP